MTSEPSGQQDGPDANGKSTRLRARDFGKRVAGALTGYRPFDPLITEFYAHLKLELGRAPRTAEEYARDIELFGAFLDKRAGVERTTPPSPFAMLSKATVSDVRQFIMELMGTQKHGAVSVRRKVASLRAFFAFELREGRRADNPAAAVKPPKAPKRLPEYLTEGEAATLLRARIPGRNDYARTRNTAIITLFYASGIRAEELRTLTMTNVDLEKRLIKVVGKGNKQRLVFINETAKTAIELYLGHRPRTAEDALFVNSSGHRLAKGFFSDLFADLRKLAGLDKHATPHILRHSFATHMLENGADIVTIKELLGHESLATTQIYTNVSLEHMRKTYIGTHPLDRMKDV